MQLCTSLVGACLVGGCLVGAWVLVKHYRIYIVLPCLTVFSMHNVIYLGLILALDIHIDVNVDVSVHSNVNLDADIDIDVDVEIKVADLCVQLLLKV